jgi:hypothetical protein
VVCGAAVGYKRSKKRREDDRRYSLTVGALGTSVTLLMSSSGPLVVSKGFKIAANSGLNPQSPAFQSAQQSCRKLLPSGGPPGQVPEKREARSTKHAQCIRAHGVPN